MAQYPYYTEPDHTENGDAKTLTSTNAARSTHTSSDEGRLIVNVENKIFLLEPNQHPLVTLMTNVGKVWDGKGWKGSAIMKRSTGNPEFGWFEDYYGGRYAKAVGAWTSAADQDVVVTGAGTNSGYIFTKGDMVKNARTGECAVVGVVTSDSITLHVRGFGSSAAAALVDGDGLYIIGNVNEEGGGARHVNSTRATKITNYTQIFRTSIAVTNTEDESDLYGGGDMTYQRAKKGTEHALDIERAFWFGQKYIDVAGDMGKPCRSTGGILEFIEQGGAYIQDQNGLLTRPDFNTFLREAFTYGSTNKTLFAGGAVIQAINEFAAGQIVTQTLDKTYGVEISKYVTAFGTINIVHNPLFANDYGGYGFLLDMDCFKYVSMNNRDTKLKTNIQAPDADGLMDEYISEVGLQRMQAPRCALIKGVTA
jgi:hypothetical protein